MPVAHLGELARHDVQVGCPAGLRGIASFRVVGGLELVEQVFVVGFVARHQTHLQRSIFGLKNDWNVSELSLRLVWLATALTYQKPDGIRLNPQANTLVEGRLAQSERDSFGITRPDPTA